jgi:hypothetical protein
MTECLQSAPSSRLAGVVAICLHRRILMIMNKSVRWFVSADCSSWPHRAWRLDPAGTIADEREFSRRGSGSAVPYDGLVACMSDAGCIAASIEVSHRAPARALLDRGIAAHADNPSQLDPEPREQSVARNRTVLKPPPRRAGEEPAPLPQWMRTTRPSRPGMLMPGFLIVLAVMTAANGILSTVLALVWL